jgi:hypothetical protein
MTLPEIELETSIGRPARSLVAISRELSRKVKFTLAQAMKTQRGVKVQLYSFFNLGARCESFIRNHSQVDGAVE